jgi:hypothetical protein
MNALDGKQIDLAAWSTRLAATAEALGADSQLAPLRASLSELAAKAAAQGAAGSGSIELLAADLQKAIDGIPYVAVVAEAIKRDLGRLLEGLRGGSTLVDAKAAVQRFIDAMPGRYLREVLDRFPERKVAETLLVLLDDAHDDIEKFKENIEIWFNNAMDRVSGWYKRQSQLIIAILSIGAAVALNVDAVAIVKYLDTHSGVRDALVAQAKAYADSASAVARSAAPASPATAASGAPAAYVARLDEVQTRLSQLNLPIGWVKDTAADAGSAGNGASRKPPSPAERENMQVLPGSWEAACRVFTFHFLGWILTALAASLGAPFWFDTLNRFISIRSAGKAPEEAPKPPKDVPVPLEPGQSPREADLSTGTRR